MEWLVFVPLAAMALTTAILVIVLRNPVYCALSLVGTFFSLSGIYLLLHAQFVAVVQVIVYAGAIMVLFLFVVMLLDLGHERPVWLQRDRPRLLIGVGAVVLLLLELVIPVGSWTARVAQDPTASELAGGVGNTQLVGRLLFTEFLVPFEITSVILLIAIIGAMVLARR